MSFLNFSKTFISLNFLILSINIFSMESDNPDRISQGKQEISYVNNEEQGADKFSPEIIDFIEYKKMIGIYIYTITNKINNTNKNRTL